MATLGTAEPARDTATRYDRGGAVQPSTPRATVRPAPQSCESTDGCGTPREPSIEPKQARRWYGWQTLTLDGALLVGSLAAIHLGGDSKAVETLAWTPVVGFVVGGPAIHLMHSEPWRALGSLGLRIGMPVLGGAIGLGMANCSSGGDFCGLGELMFGTGAGVLAATLIDSLVLARKPRPAPGDLALSLTPFISPDGAKELRLRGQF